MALILVLGALTILTVMLTEFQDETSAEFGSALSERDSVRAEYAAKSAVNLSRLLIAAEPTIRKALGPMFAMMGQAPPQLPVWQFADQVLGAFNDKEGAEAFHQLAGVNIADGKNLGFDGAGFSLDVVDEDSKIDLNTAARGDAFSQARLAMALAGLMSGAQYNPMFENPDADGSHSDRQTICGAIVDWTDPDQEGYVCDPNSGTPQGAGAEDSYYQLLKQPYQRKNAAFDSLEELRMVRGVGDDFWSAFIEPEPDNPSKRTVTVWGQGKVNVNTANAQTLLAIICGNATPGTELCVNPEKAALFLSLVSIFKQFTPGLPVFGTTKGFINTMKGVGPLGALFKAENVKPVTFLSESETEKSISAESKVFSIYATGTVKSGKRETRVKIHAVVDFRGAPPPGLPPQGPLGPGGPLGGGGTGGAPSTGSGGATGVGGAGNTTGGIPAAIQPGAGGNVVYYRIN